jgi:hypothetical protein
MKEIEELLRGVSDEAGYMAPEGIFATSPMAQFNLKTGEVNYPPPYEIGKMIVQKLGKSFKVTNTK